MSKLNFEDKVGNVSQIGGIETSVLDNGLARGGRIAWVNTGSGLRFKVAIDRALDIVDASYNQYNLAWLSHSGLVAPRPDANAGIEWLRSFGGGLLTTCGLTHTGPPEDDENGQRGLHGRISNIPAEIESVIQPDMKSDNPEMSITARVKQCSTLSESLELKRTISATLGKSELKIHDVVTNNSNISTPHMILYHCNFGWPLVDESVDIVYKGDCQSRGLDFDNETFNDKNDYKKCQGPRQEHRGFGEACGIIDIEADKDGFCSAGLANRKLNLALMMKFKKEQLSWLTNWQHWGPGDYVCALEPGTNPPIGQGKAREQNQLIILEPGESREYELEISVN